MSCDLEHLQDENRYNATRGAHLNLKHAERARATVNKIPGEETHELFQCDIDHTRQPLTYISLHVDSFNGIPDFEDNSLGE